MSDPIQNSRPIPGAVAGASDRCYCRHRRDDHDGPCTAVALGDDHDLVTCPCAGFVLAAGPLPTGEWESELADGARIERLQAIDLQPGDLIIGTLPADCTQTLAEAVGADLQTRFPDNPTMLLPTGVSMHTVRFDRHVDVAPPLPEGWTLHTASGPAVQALAARGFPTTASNGSPLTEEDAAAVMAFADHLRRIEDAMAARATGAEPHRPPGYATATGPDDTNERYIPTGGAAPICGDRYQATDIGPMHICALPAGHGGPTCRCTCGDGWNNLNQVTAPDQETS